MNFKKACLTSTVISLSLISEIAGFSQIALAQQAPVVPPGTPIAYPAKGQNPEQQEQDQFDCYSWAKGQTGFDPSQPQPTPGAQPALHGGPLMRKEQEQKIAQAQAQVAAQQQQKKQSYYQAWTACMTGRGYSVR